MKTIGIFGGRFTPLHNGHVGAILRAAEHVDTLYVVLSYANSDPIKGSTRLKWMNAVFSVYKNIVVIDVERQKILETVGEWLDDAYNIRTKITAHMFDISSIYRNTADNIKINKVFVGSNDHDDMFKICYPEAEIVILDPLRSDITISGTEIRTNIYRHWEYIPKFVRKDYAKMVSVLDDRLRNQLTDRFSTVKVENVYDAYVDIYGETVVKYDKGISNIIMAKYLLLCDEAAYNANRVYFTPAIYTPEGSDVIISPKLFIGANAPLDEAIELVKNLIK